MGVLISIDTIEHPPTISDGPTGLTLTRTAIVGQLSGQDAGKPYEAITTSQVPQRGEGVSGVPDVVALDISATMISDSQARVRIVYRVPTPEDNIVDEGDPAKQIDVATTFKTKRTDLDRFQNQMIVAHTFTDTDPDGNVIASPRQQVKTVEVPAPLSEIVISRIETQSPIIKGRLYSGTVNADLFGGAPPRTVKCQDISGTSDDGGQTYKVTYRFEYDEDGWDAELTYIDDDGTVPEDLVDGVGRINPQITRQASYNPLNIF